MKRFLALFAVLVAWGGLSSCGLFHKRVKSMPPPPPPPQTARPAPPPSKTPSQRSAEIVLPEPPEVNVDQPDLTHAPPAQAPALPKFRRRASRSPRREAQEASAQPAEPAQQQPAQLPQLGEILTAQQQAEYQQSLDRNLSGAQKTLAALSGRRLNPEQSTYLDRIRSFMQQAEEARRTDLVRANSLAERARVLAEDLIKSAQ
jgi:hypothetical protein